MLWQSETGSHAPLLSSGAFILQRNELAVGVCVRARGHVLCTHQPDVPRAAQARAARRTQKQRPENSRKGACDMGLASSPD